MPDIKPITANDDVAKPGTVPPLATSKPVVPQSTTVQDPMVAAQTVAVGSVSSQPRVAPQATADEIRKDTQTESDKAEAAKSSQKSEQDIAGDRQARLSELIENGEYNVSIGQLKDSKTVTTFLTTVLMVLFVGALFIFILTDLKLIDLGIKLPFHVFKQ